MSGLHTTQRDLLLELEALITALMGDALPAEVKAIADRMEASLNHGGEIPAAAIAEVRSAIELLHSGQPCAAVSALVAARSELGAPSA